MPLHRRLVGPHLGPSPRSARGLHPPRHPHPVDLVPDADVGRAPFHEHRRGPRADGHLEDLLRFLDPLGGQGPLEAPLVVVARLAPGGLEGERGESLDRLDLGLHLDAELSEEPRQETAHVPAGEDLLRLPHLGVVLRTVDQRRDEPGQRHDHLAGDRGGDHPGQEGRHREREGGERSPEIGPQAELCRIARDPVARHRPADDLQPPADQRQDRQPTPGLAGRPPGVRRRPPLGQARRGGQQHGRHRDGRGEKVRRQSSHHVTPMPLSAIISASRLGAISSASLRSMSP